VYTSTWLYLATNKAGWMLISKATVLFNKFTPFGKHLFATIYIESEMFYNKTQVMNFLGKGR
jgi:hypothetical protein